MECSQEGCDRTATFELYIPWTDNKVVCAAHARVDGQQDGVVADPLESADDELPDGAANQE
jgi:hypothetical protein